MFILMTSLCKLMDHIRSIKLAPKPGWKFLVFVIMRDYQWLVIVECALLKSKVHQNLSQHAQHKYDLILKLLQSQRKHELQEGKSLKINILVE